MFGLKKKLKENALTADELRSNSEASKLMRENNIEKIVYNQIFLKKKGIAINKNTPELVNEYLTDNSWIKQYDIDCWVQLNETYLDTNNYAGAALSGGRSNFTTTNRKQLKVKTHVYIADKGVVFKKAINKAEDLRLPWDTITDINEDGKTLEIICDAVTYVVWFVDKNIAQVFYAYVSSHMSGVADDGWS